MINNVTLMGRLTAHPELKTTTGGTSVTSFNIAVDRNYQKQGQDKQTDFITCVAWRNTAEFITRWFRKGDMIAIVGEIQTRKFTDKEGNSRTAVEVLVNNASFCGGKNNGTEAPATESAPAATVTPVADWETINEEDLPF